MATTKTFETKGAGTFEITGIVPARVAEAGRQLKRDGIATDLSTSDLESSPLLSAELARVCIVRWTMPDGTEPLAGLKPRAARELLLQRAGVIDFVVGRAREIEKEDAADLEVVTGN